MAQTAPLETGTTFQSLQADLSMDLQDLAGFALDPDG